jgi:hypothetical protein
MPKPEEFDKFVLPNHALDKMAKIKISDMGWALYQALVSQKEQEPEESRDGSVWQLVYLDNATAELNPRPDGRHLSNLFAQLTREGLYKCEDNEFRGAWGSVRIAPEPIRIDSEREMTRLCSGCKFYSEISPADEDCNVSKGLCCIQDDRLPLWVKDAEATCLVDGDWADCPLWTKPENHDEKTNETV